MGVCSGDFESNYFGNTIRFTGVVAGLVDPALTVPKLEALADDHSELVEPRSFWAKIVAGSRSKGF